MDVSAFFSFVPAALVQNFKTILFVCLLLGVDITNDTSVICDISDQKVIITYKSMVYHALPPLKIEK